MSMRKRISLYIASQLVDLDDQSFILFNYTSNDTTHILSVDSNVRIKRILA